MINLSSVPLRDLEAEVRRRRKKAVTTHYCQTYPGFVSKLTCCGRKVDTLLRRKSAWTTTAAKVTCGLCLKNMKAWERTRKEAVSGSASPVPVDTPDR